MHNQRALQLRLHGFKIEGTSSDFIDPEFEKMMEGISKKHHESDKLHEDNLHKAMKEN